MHYYTVDPNLPLWFVVQDLHSTYVFNPAKHVLDHADYTAPTRHELRSCRSGINLPCLADLDHELGIGDPSISPMCEMNSRYRRCAPSCFPSLEKNKKKTIQPCTWQYLVPGTRTRYIPILFLEHPLPETAFVRKLVVFVAKLLYTQQYTQRCIAV